jgi:hypothetical protein
LLSLSLYHLHKNGQAKYRCNLHHLPMFHLSILILLDMFVSSAVSDGHHLCHLTLHH